MDAGKLVVELQHDDGTADCRKVGAYDPADRRQVALCTRKKGGAQVGEDRNAAFEIPAVRSLCARIGIVFPEPFRNAVPGQLGVLVGTRTQKNLQSELSRKRKEIGEIALLAVIEQEPSVCRLMDAPGDVGGKAVCARFA